MREIFDNVYQEGGALFTKTALPRAKDVYEPWDPQKSKLAAMIAEGPEHFPLNRRSHVLYLGAGAGSTARRVAIMCTEGVVYCVEPFPTPFQRLLSVCERHENMVPVMADARSPERYIFIAPVDCIYQDIAQPDQARIFLLNWKVFEPGRGVLMVKARCIDAAREPQRVFDDVKTALEGNGLDVLESIPLPYYRGHEAIVVRKAQGR